MFKLNHLHLKTRDPQGTARFYEEVLGARITRQSARGGYHLDLHGRVGGAMPLLADAPGMHFRWHMAEGRDFADLVEILHRPVGVGGGRDLLGGGGHGFTPTVPVGAEANLFCSATKGGLRRPDQRVGTGFSPR